jgi:hypothetical protein
MESQDFGFSITALMGSVYKEDAIYRDFDWSMLKEGK